MGVAFWCGESDSKKIHARRGVACNVRPAVRLDLGAASGSAGPYGPPLRIHTARNFRATPAAAPLGSTAPREVIVTTAGINPTQAKRHHRTEQKFHRLPPSD